MSEPAAADNVVPMRKQLSLDPGGATVDTAKIGGITWAAGTKDLDEELVKGSDVRVTLVARVTGVPFDDKYDAHGHIAETIRSHDLRIDSIEQIETVSARAYTTAAEAEQELEEEQAKAADAPLGGEPAADDDGEGAGKPAAEEEPEADPFGADDPAPSA